MIGRNAAFNSHFDVEKCIMCSHSFVNCWFFADAELIRKRVWLADQRWKTQAFSHSNSISRYSQNKQYHLSVLIMYFGFDFRSSYESVFNLSGHQIPTKLSILYKIYFIQYNNYYAGTYYVYLRYWSII